MHIGERIRQKRKELGLTQGDLARQFGISNVSVSEWERGLGKPDQDKLTALAKRLQTTVNYLLTGRNERDQTEISVASLLNRTSGLPVIPISEAALWSDKMAEEKEKFEGERIPCPFPHSEDAFITRVQGDSNYEPTADRTFSDGDFIAVDPQKRPQHKSMVLVTRPHEEGAELRQLLVEPDGSRMLEALKLGWPNRIRQMDIEEKIIGTVIGKWVPV